MPKKTSQKNKTGTQSRIEALQNEVVQLRDALGASMAGIVIVDARKKITFVNTLLLSFFNYRLPDSLTGKSIFTLFPGQSERKKLENLFNQAVSTVPVEGELLGKQSDGSNIYLLARVRRNKGDTRKVFYTISLLDVSARRNIEEQLKDSQAIFESAFENAPIGLAVVNINGEFMRVNSALANIVGYSIKELTKKTFQDITFQKDLEKDLGYFQEMIEGKISTYSIQKRYVKKNRKPVWVQLSVSAVRDDNGKIKFFISQVQDISDQKNHTDEIMKRQNELEKINSFMIGRELRMKELKNKIKKLEKNT